MHSDTRIVSLVVAGCGAVDAHDAGLQAGCHVLLAK